MRKDWVGAGAAAADGGAFWDAHWDASGSAPTVDDLRRSDEYRFLGACVPGFRRGGLDVLDCGCGQGIWMRLLREGGHRPVGVDLARQTLARLDPACRGGAMIGDFRRLGLRSGRFDLVINWGGVEHHEDGPEVALREAARVLRPGGHLVVTTPCHNTRVRWLDRWRGLEPPAEGRFYQYRFTPGELRAELARVGFEDVGVRVIAGAQGMTRSLDQELRGVARRLPVRARWVLVRAGGVLLRRWLGHMVIAVGRKPEPPRA
jgi:SAM-dependent methyltransferase